MVKEGYVRQVDAMGRVVIPKSLREKFKLEAGQKLEICSLEDNGYCFICFGWPRENNIE